MWEWMRVLWEESKEREVNYWDDSAAKTVFFFRKSGGGTLLGQTSCRQNQAALAQGGNFVQPSLTHDKSGGCNEPDFHFEGYFYLGRDVQVENLPLQICYFALNTKTVLIGARTNFEHCIFRYFLMRIFNWRNKTIFSALCLILKRDTCARLTSISGRTRTAMTRTEPATTWPT